MSKFVRTVIFTDHIMEEFNHRGVASDFVYYELLDMVRRYVVNGNKDVIDYVEFTLGTDNKTFARLEKKADKYYHKIMKMIGE